MLRQNNSPYTDIHGVESEVALYRRRFPFPLVEGMKCVLYEENEEISVRIYRASLSETPLKWENLQFVSHCKESEEKVFIRLERQTYLKDTGASVRLLSECLHGALLMDENDENEYYTLHICGEDGSVVLFRAFSKSAVIAYRLFDRICQSPLATDNAIDFFRESRALILRELWLHGA